MTRDEQRELFFDNLASGLDIPTCAAASVRDLSDAEPVCKMGSASIGSLWHDDVGPLSRLGA